MSYYAGALVRLSAEFRSAAGDLTDPTDVVLTVSLPGRTALNVYRYTDLGTAIEKDSAGLYHYDLALSTPGTWQYRWAGTGVLVAVAVGALDVELFPTNN